MRYSDINRFFDGHRIMVVLILCLFGLCVSSGARKKKPRKPKGDNRVYLQHADKLHYDENINSEAQIANGNVVFLHNGARLKCDSAYYYEQSNSFEAFGHVYMKEGDTLSLKCDYAYYDGNDMMAIARNNVVLKHRKSTLYTDSLNYDRLYNMGYFFEGGKLVDNKNVLVSDWGQYDTESKEAVFNYNVRLTSPSYVIDTDTLYYTTGTGMSHVVGPSTITSDSSVVNTENAYYDTKKDRAQLLGRSKIVNGQKTIVGDSLYYDSKKKISRGYKNVVYIDNENKNMFTGDYGMYDELTGYGEATHKALMADFSQGDTLWVHADSFKIYTYHINTDSVYRLVHAFDHVRAFRKDVQAVCDSMVGDSRDSCLTMYKDPILWHGDQQVLGEQVKVYMNDSTIKWAHIIGQALAAQRVRDTEYYNQLSSKEMMAYFVGGSVRQLDAVSNCTSVYYAEDEKDSSLIGMNYMTTDSMKMYIGVDRKLYKIWTPAAEATFYPISQIPPEKKLLKGFTWFDYIRPLNKTDVFNWRGKKEGTKLEKQPERQLPKSRFSENSELKMKNLKEREAKPKE